MLFHFCRGYEIFASSQLYYKHVKIIRIFFFCNSYINLSLCPVSIPIKLFLIDDVFRPLYLFVNECKAYATSVVEPVDKDANIFL